MNKEIKQKRNEELIKELSAIFTSYTFLETNNEVDIITFLCPNNHIVQRPRDWLIGHRKLFCWECEKEKSKLKIQEFIKKLPPTILIKNNPTLFSLILECQICKNSFKRQLRNTKKNIRCTHCEKINYKKELLQREELRAIIKNQLESKHLKITGIIYKLCFQDGKVYIGQSVDFKSRLRNHIKKHKSKRNIEYYTKLGQHLKKFNDVFTIEVLHKEVNWEDLDRLEVQEINKHDSFHNGLNMTAGGGTYSKLEVIKKTVDRKIKIQERKEALLKELEKKKEFKRQQKKIKTIIAALKKVIIRKQREEARIKHLEKNIRTLTTQEQHRKKLPKSSQYRGVCLDNTRSVKGKWRATIKYKQKKIHLGLYDNELDAAIAYNNKAIELFGDNAILNCIQ